MIARLASQWYMNEDIKQVQRVKRDSSRKVRYKSRHVKKSVHSIELAST